MADSQYLFSRKILTDSGLLGVYDNTLSLRDIEILGHAFATFVLRQGGHRIAVCFDLRDSSPGLATALMSGLTRSGAEALHLGAGPLHLLHFGSELLGADAAVMITGADAPPEYNGTRLFYAGRRLMAKEMLRIAEHAEAGDLEWGTGRQWDAEVAEPYCDEIVRLNSPSMSHLTVVWDAGWGLAAPTVQAVIRQLDGRHVVINAVSGDKARHLASRRPPQDRLKDLRNAIRDSRGDLGFAFDHTGERLLAVDGAGSVLAVPSAGRGTGTGPGPASRSDPLRTAVSLCREWSTRAGNNSEAGQSSSVAP